MSVRRTGAKTEMLIFSSDRNFCFGLHSPSYAPSVSNCKILPRSLFLVKSRNIALLGPATRVEAELEQVLVLLFVEPLDHCTIISV